MHIGETHSSGQTLSQLIVNQRTAYSGLIILMAIEENMARLNLEKMSSAGLSELRSKVDRLMVERQASERVALRQKMGEMAEASGMSLDALFGKGRKSKGNVAHKYRDPKNPENTWTGRGRMPRWMVAAIKGNKAKKEDLLI
jgi:DNA-binding protein H-NS